VQDDLAKIVGDAAAREIARFGGAVAKAVREAARTIDGFARGRSGPGETPGREPPAR